ncbi:hypothetical protein [Desulfoplanes sp.]
MKNKFNQIMTTLRKILFSPEKTLCSFMDDPCLMISYHPEYGDEYYENDSNFRTVFTIGEARNLIIFQETIENKKGKIPLSRCKLHGIH